MTSDVSLPGAALDFIGSDDPTPALASGVSALSAADFEALVAELERREAIAHLQLLSTLDGAHRNLRKAAARAVYRLKSRGVKAPARDVVTRIGATSSDADTEVDLALSALASPPGLMGRYWLLLGSLPGCDCLEVKGDAFGRIESIEITRSISLGKLEKMAREFERKAVRGLPVRASAHLAVQLVTVWRETMEPDRIPPMWREVERWCERARELGADPSLASARRHASHADATPLPAEQLYDLDDGGHHVPPPAVLEHLLSGMGEMAEESNLEAAEFDRRARALAHEALSRWLTPPQVRARISGWLESTADIIYASRDNEPAAAAFVSLADVVRAAAEGGDLIEHPFFHRLLLSMVGRGDKSDT